jgi:histidine triad (HIT) family protein
MTSENTECIFCKMVFGEIPVTKIYENENFFSILDINQDIKGHALIISKKHFTTILELPNSTGNEFLDCVKSTSLNLMKKHNASGFNVVDNNFESAGQIVEHFHVHILPRTKDDGLDILA